MTEFYSISLVKNIYKKPSFLSEITSQLIYGEKFKIIKKLNKWLKIKTKFDNYVGYIQNDKIINKLKPNFKSYKLKTNIYFNPNKKNKIKNKYLSFNSRIQVFERRKKFAKFEKNKWVQIKDIKSINHKEKNPFKIFKIFLNCKYIWGGKSYNGIDCSALLQMFYFYNNKFFPRDTKDQIKLKKQNKKLNKNFKGNIIFWKGHVAICVDKKNLIHAYGPKKKVLIMNIKDTIKRINKTAYLKVKKVSYI